MKPKEQIAELDKFYGRDLIYKYFFENYLTKIINKLKNYRNNPEAFRRYNNFMVRLVIGLKRLENDIKNMSENEVENKRLDYLRDLIKNIVDVNQKLDDMPSLEDAAQRQKAQGLKI